MYILRPIECRNQDPFRLKASLATVQFCGLRSLLSLLLCFTHRVPPLVLITRFSISVGHLHLKWRPWPILMILMDVIWSCDLLLLLFTVIAIRSSHSQLFRWRTHFAFSPTQAQIDGVSGANLNNFILGKVVEWSGYPKVIGLIVVPLPYAPWAEHWTWNWIQRCLMLGYLSSLLK